MVDGELMSIYNIDPASEGITYEYYLRLDREYYEIVKQRSSMDFCKMRANICCRWGYRLYSGVRKLFGVLLP